MAQMMRGSRAWVAGRGVGLSAIVLLQTYWFLQPGPVALKAMAAALVILSIARPSSGLLVFAGLAPLSTAIVTLCCGYALGPQLIEQAALAVGVGTLLRSGPTDGRTRIGAPALLVSMVALASALAMVPAETAPLTRGLSDAGLVLQQLISRQQAISSPIWAPLFAALTVAECGLLAWCVERAVRREPHLGARIVFFALAGTAGTGLLSLQSVVGAALRTGDTVHELARMLMTVRTSMQTDVHADASTFLLVGVAALGLLKGPWPRRMGVGLLLLLVAAGLWITGSRVALALGVAATIAVIAWSANLSGLRRFFAACLAVVAIVAVTSATLYPARYFPVATSASSRLVLIRLGFQLFRESPVFGIGITKFYGASASLGGPGLVSQVGYARENAHNNFVQVLAEQGLVGFGALLWWLGVVVVGAVRAQRAAADTARGCLLAAIVACIGTWMTGHPLLVPEFAFLFWLYCGVLAAATPAIWPAGPRPLLWLLIAGVLASMPLRAYVLRNATDLEHVGFGLSSLWGRDDSQHYREAGASFALFVPATGQPVEVPLRRAPGAPDPLVVDASIQGRLINRISVKGDAWQTFLVAVRPGPRRYELVDFVVLPPAGGAVAPGVLLRIGKDVAR
jgi:hypothetical protein